MTDVSPKASRFALQGTYLSEGRINISVAHGEVLALALKINAEGGENALHAHQGEEHSFVVLEGEVTFFDQDEGATTLYALEGIFIPEGAPYRYLNTGAANLFMLRIGATLNPTAAPYGDRVDVSGQNSPAESAANHHKVGVPISGKLWGAA